MATATTTSTNAAVTTLAPNSIAAATIKMTPAGPAAAAAMAPRIKKQVNFAQLPFPRKCIFKFESLHWPSLFFPGGYEQMVQEVEDIETVIFEDGAMNELSLDMVEEMQQDEEASTCPLILLLGINQLILSPPQEDILSFTSAAPAMMKEGKSNPDLDEAIKLVSKLHKHCKKPTGRKRKAIRITPRPSNGNAAPASAAKPSEAKPAATVLSVKPLATAAPAFAAKPAAAPSVKPAAIASSVKPVATVAPHPVSTAKSAATVPSVKPATTIAPASAAKPTATVPSEKPAATVAPPASDAKPAAPAPSVTPAPAFATPKPTSNNTTTKPSAKETPPQPEPTESELLAEAQKTCVAGNGNGPLLVAPALDSAKRQKNNAESNETISPSEYRCCQKGASVQDYSASLNSQSTQKAGSKKDNGRVSPSKVQGDPTAESPLNSQSPKGPEELEDSNGHIPPSLYGTCQGDPIRTGSSLNSQAPKGPEEGSNNGGISPSQFQFQRGPTVKKFSASLGTNEATTAAASMPVHEDKSVVADNKADVLMEGAPASQEVEKKESARHSSRRRGRPKNKNTKTPRRRQPNRTPKPSPPANTLLAPESPEMSGGKKPLTARELSSSEREVPTFHDVMPDLDKLGFNFINRKSNKNKTLYCFPSYKPSSSNVPIEDQDYFTSETAFRARLCSHGLGDLDDLGQQAKVHLESLKNSEMESKLERWIRLSIVANLKEQEGSKLSKSVLLFQKPFPLLEKLGFKWDNKGYFFPLVKENDGIWKSNEEGIRVEWQEADFFTKLSRFGFPEQCRFDEISTDERRLLELFLSLHPRDWISCAELGAGGRTRARIRNRDVSKTDEPKSAKRQKKAPPTSKSARKASVQVQHSQQKKSSSSKVRSSSVRPQRTPRQLNVRQGKLATSKGTGTKNDGKTAAPPATNKETRRTSPRLQVSSKVETTAEPMEVDATKETGACVTASTVTGNKDQSPPNQVQHKKTVITTGSKRASEAVLLQTNTRTALFQTPIVCDKAVVNSTGKSPGEENAKKIQSKKRSDFNLRATSVQSPAVCDKDALADCNRKPFGDDSARKDLSGRDISAEIERSDHVAQLNSCLEKLEGDEAIDDAPDKGIVFGPTGSHFKDNAITCYDLLEKLVGSRVSQDSSSCNDMKNNPAALYLCGPPGIGKTTAANWFCRRVINQFTDRDGYWSNRGIKPAFVDMNCTQLSSGGTDVRRKVLNAIWEACNDSANSRKEFNETSLEKMLTSTSGGEKNNKRFVILVLDEIDQLVISQDSESENPRNNGEKLIEELSQWSSDPSRRFAVVGIGNAMNGNKYRRIIKFMKFHGSFLFSHYGEEDIASILRGRVKGIASVDPKALTFIAKKTSAIKGDARQAIEMLTTAIRNAKQRAEELADNGAPPPKGPYMVTMRDVVKLNKEYNKLTELIDGLPLFGKLVVLGAVNLAIDNRSSGSNIQLTRRDLQRAASAVVREKLQEEMVDEGALIDQIQQLDDIGLASIETQYGVDADDPVVFNHTTEELDSAVAESLGKDGSGFFI